MGKGEEGGMEGVVGGIIGERWIGGNRYNVVW